MKNVVLILATGILAYSHLSSQAQVPEIIKLNYAETESSTEISSCGGFRNFEYSQNLDFSGSYSIGFPGNDTDINSHLRRFKVVDNYRVIEHVTFFFRGLADVEIRVYSIDSNDPLNYANMTLNGSAIYNPIGFEYGLKSVPISAVIPDGGDIVVELSVCASGFPSCSRIGYNSSLFGAMIDPNQTAPSYLSFNRGVIRDLGSFSGTSSSLASVMLICSSDGIVPTLSEWSIIQLGLCLLILFVIAIKKKSAYQSNSI